MLSMLNGCLQAHIPNDEIWAYLWMPLGLMMGLCRGYIKNANGQLQFASGVVLQAMGHFIYTLINAIKWVNSGSWLPQPEGVLSVILEVFQEKWLMLSAALIATWQVAEQYVLQCGGAWELGKANYVTVLPTKGETPDPHPRPVRGSMHDCQVKQDLCFKASAALLSLLMLQQHALAPVPSFEFQNGLLSRVEEASGSGIFPIRNLILQDQYMIRLQAEVQDILQDLLSCEERGYLSIMTVGQDPEMVMPKAVIIPQGFLECECKMKDPEMVRFKAVISHRVCLSVKEK